MNPPASLRNIFLFAVVAALASTFWLLTITATFAGSTCQVCHKRNQTLTFNCADVEYFRHLDHGDPMGPCPGTRTATDPSSRKGN